MLGSLSSAQITVTTTLINVSSSFQSQLGCHFPQENLSDCSLPRCPFPRACPVEPVLSNPSPCHTDAVVSLFADCKHHEAYLL